MNIVIWKPSLLNPYSRLRFALMINLITGQQEDKDCGVSWLFNQKSNGCYKLLATFLFLASTKGPTVVANNLFRNHMTAPLVAEMESYQEGYNHLELWCMEEKAISQERKIIECRGNVSVAGIGCPSYWRGESGLDNVVHGFPVSMAASGVSWYQAKSPVVSIIIGNCCLFQYSLSISTCGDMPRACGVIRGLYALRGESCQLKPGLCQGAGSEFPLTAMSL